MHALKLVRQHADEIRRTVKDQNLTKGEAVSWFLTKFEDELDEYSLNNIGIIEKHIGEITNGITSNH